MDSEDVMPDDDTDEKGFGPIFSRIYSFFSSRSRRSGSLYEYISNEVSSEEKRNILDIGCGPGILIGKLASKNERSVIYGVDPSASMISIARKRLKDHITGGNVVLSQGSSMNVPFDTRFDLILSSMSFHHWEKKEESLKYLATKLSPDGVIVVFERFRDDGRPDNDRMQHSLSRSQAEKLNIEGMRKSIKVEDNIISVSFSAER